MPRKNSFHVHGCLVIPSAMHGVLSLFLIHLGVLIVNAFEFGPIIHNIYYLIQAHIKIMVYRTLPNCGTLYIYKKKRKVFYVSIDTKI